MGSFWGDGIVGLPATTVRPAGRGHLRPYKYLTGDTAVQQIVSARERSRNENAPDTTTASGACCPPRRKLSPSSPLEGRGGVGHSSPVGGTFEEGRSVQPPKGLGPQSPDAHPRFGGHVKHPLQGRDDQQDRSTQDPPNFSRLDTRSPKAGSKKSSIRCLVVPTLTSGSFRG